jgi:hypothetical protein
MQKGAIQFIQNPFQIPPKQLVKKLFKEPRQVTALACEFVETSDGLRFCRKFVCVFVAFGLEHMQKGAIKSIQGPLKSRVGIAFKFWLDSFDIS